MAQIRGLIERRKEYPVQARKTGQEGITMVSFVLGKNGELKEARIAVPSGRTLLDRAALRAVESVRRFPPFPIDTWGDSRTFQVPISFSLE
jgi:protein TonB